MNRLIRVLNDNNIFDIAFKIVKRIRMLFNYYYIKYVKVKVLSKREEKLNDLSKPYNSNMNFYFQEYNRDNILDFYDNQPELKKSIIKEANDICLNKFKIFGMNINFENKYIEWNKDFKVNFIWDNKFYKDIKTIDLDNDSDVKIPWELSRFNHLFTLGKAYYITENEVYYQTMKKQIRSWKSQNPYYHSVNWTNTMEVSIRAINFIFSYYQFKNLIDKDYKFKNELDFLLKAHADYIFENLENYSKNRNNHYISNLVGLLYLGIYFKNDIPKKSNKWIKFSIRELEKEMKKQINNDGTSYESSTNYQRVVAELFLHAHMILKINGVNNLSDFFKNRLIKMFNFLKSITKENTLTPLIGDIDNGRLLIISNYSTWNKKDYNQLLNVAAYYLGDDSLNVDSENYKEELIWLVNEKEYKPKLNYAIDYQFPDGGFFVLRNEEFYILIRCGELSMRGQGGHSHNDQLSFELSVNGEDFFVDPGSFTYTGSSYLRNIDRSTSNHNTVYFEGLEQNTYYDDLFAMPEESFGEVTEVSKTHFIGKHVGFAHKNGVIHERYISIRETEVIINDKILPSHCKETGIIVLILSEHTKVSEINNIVYFQTNGVILKSNIDIENLTIEETYISEGYNIRKKSKKLKLKFTLENDIKLELIT